MHTVYPSKVALYDSELPVCTACMIACKVSFEIGICCVVSFSELITFEIMQSYGSSVSPHEEKNQLSCKNILSVCVFSIHVII